MESFIDQAKPMSNNTEYTTLPEVKRAIKRRKKRKSPETDGISTQSLKSLPPVALHVIVSIFYAILRLSHFPESWKLARVIMIPNPGKSEEEVESYRPMSLLCTFSKLFERILLSRMEQYTDEVLPDHQFEFRAGHGTTEQCHRIVQ